MQKRQVVLGLLVPADQQSSEAVHPRMRPFHDPPTRFEACFSLDGFGLFPTRANMSGEPKFAQDLTHLLIVIARIQTHPLWLLLRRLGARDDDRLDGRTRQFHVMPIGAFYL